MAPGSEVTSCYEVQHTRGVTLTLYDLADNRLSDILTGFPFTLTPGAPVFLTRSATITRPMANVATWTAYHAGPTDVVTATAAAFVDVQPRLQVGHLAPFGPAGSTAVTVTLDGTPVLTDFVYAASTGYLPVPAISGTVVLTIIVDYTVVAAGDGANQLLRVFGWPHGQPGALLPTGYALYLPVVIAAP